jgi:hypothetical protein
MSGFLTKCGKPAAASCIAALAMQRKQFITPGIGCSNVAAGGVLQLVFNRDYPWLMFIATFLIKEG